MTRHTRAALAGLVLGVIAIVGPASAQGYGDDNIDARLDRIEQDLRDLQDQMYQTGGPASSGAGPSMQKLNDLEQSIRNLTGQVEQLSHDTRTVKERLDRLETETNFRLNQLEGNPNPPAGSGTPGDQPASDGGAPPSSGTPGSAGDGGPKPPGSIGDIPERKAGSSAEETYNRAMDLLTKAEYDNALGLFRQVVRDYPETDYAAQAQYWIADIHYVQKNYEPAALAFADVLKKYPQSGRGPEAMLKLGLSLINIGKTKEGCTALGAIKQKYPKASDAILGRAEREAKKAGCSS
jgi:tol-pal system protein YbgF